MTHSEIIDTLLRLMDMHFVKYRQSRDIEVKVNLAIWTALVVLGKFLSDKSIKLDSFGTWLVYALVPGLLLFCHYWFWLKPIQASEDRDSDYLAACRREIQLLTGASIEYPKLQQSWMVFQVGFSGAILTGIAVILSI